MEKPGEGVVTTMGIGVGAEAKANEVGIGTEVVGVISEMVVGVVGVISEMVVGAVGVISEMVVGVVGVISGRVAGVMGVIAGMIDAKAGEMEGKGFRKKEEDEGVMIGVVRGRGKKWLHRRALRQRLCRLRTAWTAWPRRSWRADEPTRCLTWPSLCLVRGSDSM